MFDTMTVTKALAGFLGAFLILLLGKWAAEGVYAVGGHGAEQAYTIEVAEADTGDAAAEEGPSFEELYAAADPAAGEKSFKACGACHKVNGENGTGPHLNGVVGRDIASVEGFAYSEALSGLPGNWEPQEIAHFITNPKAYAPGTKMTYPGMKDAEDRADVVAYLASLN